VNFFDKEEKYEILKVIEFTSARKRMSMIVRTPEGKIELFCKGADNVIMERRSKQLDPTMIEDMNTAISEFSRIGLRTLLIAHVPLSDSDYEKFKEEFHHAETSLDNREEKMQEVAEKIEQNLMILGATAVEDKLQEDVAETIDYLIRCGIRVWMLTGDKLETAISIGKSTKFLAEDMNFLIIDTEESSQTGERLDLLIQEARGGIETPQGTELKPLNSNAMIITGKSLVHALKDYPDKFLELSEMSKSVICCRVSPLQKSEVVSLVRKKRNRICLSIGDGANDVSMIQKANIGVGIVGLEGAQAVRASDFAFKEFRTLKRLIAVHGRYSYIRMAKLILYSFYKNLTLIYPQFIGGFYTGWSGVPLYNQFVLTCFNIFFTSLPPFFMAIFEKDLDEKTIYEYPQAYLLIRSDYHFNWKRVVEWNLSSIIHGVLLFFFFFLSYNEGVLSSSGQELGGFYLTNVLMAYLVLTIVLVKYAFTTYHWNWAHTFAGGVSYILLVGLIFAVASESYVTFEDESSDLGMAELLMGTPYFYLTLVLTVIAAGVPDMTYAYYKRNYYPSDFEILQEDEVLKKSPKGNLFDS